MQKRDRKKCESFLMSHPFCFNCHSNENLVVHHIVPISAGGVDDYSNMAVLCGACHDLAHGIARSKCQQGWGELIKAGIEKARENGTRLGKPPVDKKTVDIALKMYDSGKYKAREITEKTGIGNTTLYKYVKLRRIENEQY
jgi:hypothetical protein